MTRAGRILAGGLLAVVASTALAGEWSFVPAAQMTQTYTSNARRTEEGPESDTLTLLQADLDLVYAGRISRFEAGYRPSYEYFWRATDLSTLSQLGRLLWSGRGGRTQATVGLNYFHGEDPRVEARTPGTAPLPGDPVPDPFLVERSSLSSTELNADLTFDLGGRATLHPLVYGRLQRFADPDLLDSDELGGSLEYARPIGARGGWTARYRYSRFDGEAVETEPAPVPAEDPGALGVHIVEAGGHFPLGRAARLSLRGGGIVDTSGEVLAELDTSDRLLGELRAEGSGRVLRWSAGVDRNVVAGGGLRLAVLQGSAFGDLSWTLGPRDTLGVAASVGHSRQPVESGSVLDLTTEQISLHAEHRFHPSWTATFQASYLSQESTDAIESGVFRDERVSIGLRWSERGRAQG